MLPTLAGVTPYYRDDWCAIYHGDVRQLLLPGQQLADIVLADPVWPNAHPALRSYK